MGNNVYLPSFGTGSPTAASHSPAGPQRNDIVVIATPSAVRGERGLESLNVATLYTIYLQTGRGVAVMQYGQAASRQGYDQELQPPQALNVELPSNFGEARIVVRCVLDVFGKLRQMRTVESSDPNLPVQMLRVLREWRFRPAERNSQPVEVDVLLGFGGNPG